MAPHGFFFNDTPTTEIYTLSLHDALPICRGVRRRHVRAGRGLHLHRLHAAVGGGHGRSEEHTSELQSRLHPACRTLLEKTSSGSTSTAGWRTRTTRT